MTPTDFLRFGETLDITYQDVFKDFDLVWCVKDLNVSHSDFVVTCTVRPHMGIISCIPLGCVGSPRWL